MELAKCKQEKCSISELYDVFRCSSCVCTDTRSIVPNSFFFALKGERFNGNAFARQALEQGARAAVIDEATYMVEGCILVDDALDALQQLARHHRRQLGVRVVGITGTNGKTTTKELLAAVLATKYCTVATRGNLNNHIGVPLTLLSLTPDVEVAVVEMGANHPNDIAELVEIVEPNCGLITNIGRAHLAGFGSFEGVVRAKTALYRYLAQHNGMAFYNSESEVLAEQVVQCGLKHAIAYSTFADGPVRVAERNGFLRIELSIGGVSHCLDTHLVGVYNAENVMAALAVGLHMGVLEADALAAVAAYEPSNNRSQRIDTGRNVVIMDAYNANPSSMAAAIGGFAALAAGNKVAIVGEMLELGHYAAQEHRRVVEQLAAAGIDRVMLVGGGFAAEHRGFEYFATAADCAAAIRQHPIEGSTVLLKGSRGVRLEQLLDLL